MAKEITYEEIVRNLKNRVYAPVYFLMGEEDYYIDRIAEYITDTVLNETERSSICPSSTVQIPIYRPSSTPPNAIR